MKKIFYEKVGRRYLPVAEYDSEYLDSFVQGNHLVMCYPGGQSRRYNIDPNHAAMIAAGRMAEDAICAALRQASELRPQKALLTEGQRKAWKKLAKELGDDAAVLTVPSARDIAEAAVQAMIAEAETMMQHPAVQDAYEHFQTVWKLVKTSHQE